MSARDRLIAELREHALVIGKVTLSSGLEAEYYVDAKRAILRRTGFMALGELLAERARDWDATALGGMTMGADAVGAAATDDQITQMELLLHDALDAGAMGFSTSQAPTHNDGDGNPVPSRAATREDVDRFIATVAARYRTGGSSVYSKLVYTGTLAGAGVREHALSRGVELLSFAEYQLGYDLRPYAQRQAEQLDAGD